MGEETEATGLATTEPSALAVDLGEEDRVIDGPISTELPPPSEDDIQLVREAYARHIEVLGERERPKVPLTYDLLQTHEQRAWQAAVLG